MEVKLLTNKSGVLEIIELRKKAYGAWKYIDLVDVNV